jgi:membrane-associated phospholipid phosphatase
MNWPNLLAICISAVFHPVLILFYLCLLSRIPGFLNPELGHPLSTIQIVLVFAASALIPVLLFTLLRITGLMKSLYMEDRSDRHLPHLLTFGVYLYIGTDQKLFFFLPEWLSVMFVGSAVCIALVGLITLFWKISSHMAGMGGFTAWVIFQHGSEIENYGFVFGAILTSILVGIGRLYLKAHNLKQILAGFFLGIVGSSISVCFFAGLF